MISFASFVAAHRSLSEEQFLARVRDPYLLLEASRLEEQPKASFRTVKFTAEAMAAAATPALDAPEAFLLPVRKREGGNAFGMMITLGRANNNDLVIPDKRISKFHAYFKPLGETWRVYDANSRNGTYVDATRVPPDGGLEVHSQARIKLAKALEVTYLEPRDLYRRIGGR